MIKWTQGVQYDKVFELENTVTSPDPYVGNGTVVKIKNKFYNVKRRRHETMTVSTIFKKLESVNQEEGTEAQEEEPDMSMIEGDNSPADVKADNSDLKSVHDNKSDIGSHYAVLQTGDDAAQAEELAPDETKYTGMKMDGLDDNFTNNWTKIVKEGTMDDVFIIEKVDQHR